MAALSTAAQTIRHDPVFFANYLKNQGAKYSAQQDYQATSSNSYLFKATGRFETTEFALVMFDDEFGRYLVLARKVGNDYWAIPPYIESYVDDAKVLSAGSPYLYLVSKLPIVNERLQNYLNPPLICPPTSFGLAGFVGYDLAAGDVRFNPLTVTLEIAKTPPLSHTACQ